MHSGPYLGRPQRYTSSTDLEEEYEMKAVVEEIYIAAKGSVAMERVEEVRAIEKGGLQGDRYKEGSGYWTSYGDVCEVTLIEGEDLDEIKQETGFNVKNGEHRRNIVTRGIKLRDLRGTLFRGKRFRVGEVVLEYDRPRPPCRHIQDLTEPGMTRALRRRGGICAKVVESGRIRVRDEIVIL
jgi:MOSC domain-containing protein YiiM